MTQNIERVVVDPALESPSRTSEPSYRGRAVKNPPQWWQRPWIIPLVLVIGAFFAYNLHRFWGKWEESQAPIPPHQGFDAYYPLLLTHMSFGAIAMITATLQVWPAIRRNRPTVHRVSGWLYVIAALVSGIAALSILRFAPPVGRIGIGLATVVWMGTAVIGFVLARLRRYALHRAYMLVSFVTLLSIIWGVVFVEIGLRLPVTIDMVYIGYLIEGSRWAGWVVNLLILQWWLYRTAGKPLDLPQHAR